MGKYILQRLGYMLVTLFLIATISFFLMHFLPGTPITNENKLTPEQREIILDTYGLNDPMPVQYVKYLGGIVTGDLGISFQYDNRPVTDILMDGIGPSMQLGAQALLIGTILGVLLGLVAAIYHNGFMDYTSTIVAVLGTSIPSFVFAALLQYVLAVQLGWFPVATWKGFEYTILPTIALAIFPLATCARFVRTEMIEVLGEEYITTARAKGLKGSAIIFKHGIRNALIPLITVLGPLAVGLLTGTLVIERVFSVPGIGQQFVSSVTTNDFPIIMGTTLLFAVFFIVMLLVIDILYGLIDPRIRLAGGK
ncbi:oligopeptide ABC transporter permease [Terribacillus saccharophilus]|uniref:Peptide ABC transporter permease n=1 Tax=Terribacillus saccharophilus TaxID=361277 RepID=A0A268A8K3_9BACI|nr:oligopeptide ABC transporter permease [Terribacillus saccharophilus]PAD20451.1 peptide ABC transporter permease [Terribacillus saccharophilus]PAF17701.1 peptide ABC transporter permease [Terribacillus saccharophilus]PAF21451.1 peptide ABC transporter permease [Terribacillus saccharophilus]PAF38157.1 peptide ABC transporter permease [Terribacillus saccharophilus]